MEERDITKKTNWADYLRNNKDRVRDGSFSGKVWTDADWHEQKILPIGIVRASTNATKFGEKFTLYGTHLDTKEEIVVFCPTNLEQIMRGYQAEAELSGRAFVISYEGDIKMKQGNPMKQFSVVEVAEDEIPF